MRQAALLVLFLSLTTLPLACERNGADDGNGPLTVAVSIAPQAWLVEQLAGADANIITLVRPGESPATYQPSDAQISAVMKASLYFRIGVPFESGPWFEAIRTSQRCKVIDTRRDITLRAMDARQPEHEDAGPGAPEDAGDDDEHARGLDPHIWLSPPLLKIQARTMTEALSELAPAHAAEFQGRLAQLERKLDDLDGTLRRRLQPLRGRAFLVFHPAWGYFAEEYGLRQVAIEIEGKEPADHELTTLQALAREEGIAVVFVQPQISGAAAEAIAGAIGGRLETLDPLAADVEENLLGAAEALLDSCR